MKNCKIENEIHDEERALYNLKDATVMRCKFEGPQDGESALKECRDIEVVDCKFSLRYPLWHANRFMLVYSTVEPLARAGVWYSSNGSIEKCKIDGVKFLRECKNISIDECDISSSEFGWDCKNIKVSNSGINSLYLFFRSKNINIKNLKVYGKYACQYTQNVVVKNSNFDTKDAFWHAKNVTVEDSVLQGKYLGWFSDNLTLKNCKISGIQPFCYCKNLKLINCEMDDSALGFEFSDVDAEIKGNVDSIKNPKSGVIKADSVGEIVKEHGIKKCSGKVIAGGKEYLFK